MKMLNEVIEIFEAYSHCRYDLYEGPPQSLITDALHYLRTIEKTENLYHDAVNELSKWKDEDWKDRCLPLTWDELRSMEGKPIWVEYDNHLSGRKRTKYKNWEVIDMITEDLILVKGDYSYQKDEFGDVWQAYRKERE